MREDAALPDALYTLHSWTKMTAFGVLVLCVMVALSAAQDSEKSDRNPRIFDWFGIGDSLLPRCRGCPPRSCVRDASVVKGYCCGCARVSDLLPIDCPAIRVHCPSDGRRLCRDYDYMLDCCCP